MGRPRRGRPRRRTPPRGRELIPGALSTVAALAAAPLDPDRDEAREWARRELDDAAYRAAEPTPLDRLARRIAEWFTGLFDGGPSAGGGQVILLLIVLAVLAAVVVAIIAWGRPRLVRAQSAPFAPLFGVDDARDAAALRADAEAAAGRGAWAEAIALRFRAIARALQQRGILDVPPGTTAQGFSRAAGRAFAAHDDALHAAARAFDDVRYLGGAGSADDYRRVAALDDALARDARPRYAEAATP